MKSKVLCDSLGVRGYIGPNACTTIMIFWDLLVNVIHGRSVAYSEWVVAHLKAPASVGPIFRYITDRLVIKINQFFHMNVTSQNILVEISAKFGCDNRSASFSGFKNRIKIKINWCKWKTKYFFRIEKIIFNNLVNPSWKTGKFAFIFRKVSSLTSVLKKKH